MVAIGAVLGTSALALCRGNQTRVSVLGLYVGTRRPPTAPATPARGQAPLALQLGPGGHSDMDCGRGGTLWREPMARVRAGFVKGATIFTGPDSLTMRLLQRLAMISPPRRIVVIEPDSNHPLLEEGYRALVGR